ncbi:hypothetical protein MML48_1g18698 [Holotrichia oblita]|uniref:Uncharacterized protein n=1 Tax=Holotrichia oblita TaxID=644536 RepID=A0ACB9TTD4_HOLOL|nr:hypothetical protein MML48_1g18698 [Holotrichia oblita]
MASQKSWILVLFSVCISDFCLCILPEDMTTLAVDDIPSRQNDKFSNTAYPYLRGETGENNVGGGDEYVETRVPDHVRRCSQRLENALQEMRRRKLAKQKTLHLNGYTLHQQLRTIPYEMYVTDMRVRLPPSNSWVKVDRCYFEPTNSSLETRLLFNDLSISGKVNLFGDGELLQREPNEPNPDGSCNMILRLRRAGIGFHTEPIRRERGQFNVRTDSHFLEPGFISVYAYGCEPHLKEHRRSFDNIEDDEELSREMEDIFIKGIRSLLTTYMQRELQPAIKETLMTSMGYTISYG